MTWARINLVAKIAFWPFAFSRRPTRCGCCRSCCCCRCWIRFRRGRDFLFRLRCLRCWTFQPGGDAAWNSICRMTKICRRSLCKRRPALGRSIREESLSGGTWRKNIPFPECSLRLEYQHQGFQFCLKVRLVVVAAADFFHRRSAALKWPEFSGETASGGDGGGGDGDDLWWREVEEAWKSWEEKLWKRSLLAKETWSFWSKLEIGNRHLFPPEGQVAKKTQ